MQLVSGLVIISPESQMKLLFPDIIRMGMLLEPGQFQLKLTLFISYINDDSWLMAALLPTRPYRGLCEVGMAALVQKARSTILISVLKFVKMD